MSIALTALLFWLVLYPILSMVADAMAPGAVREFLSRPADRAALAASVWISLASVALAAAIGVPLAFLFERYEFPGRRTLGSLVVLPVVLPPLVGVVAFLFLYGEAGFVARAVRAVLGLDGPPWRLQGAAAILLVHAYSMYVYFYLFTRAGLARLDASMVEAAQSLGAGRWDTLRRVTLPLLRPSLTGAALLTFMTALGSFSAPYVFGGGFRVLPTQIYASKLNGELAVATVETLALAALALAGLWVLRRVEGEDILVALGKGTAPRRRELVSGRTRAAATAAGWGFAALLLLPHVTLVLVSLVPFGTWTTEPFPPVLGFDNYRVLATEPERLRPLVNSLWMAAASTAAAVVVALVAGWLVVRERAALRRVIEWLVALPWGLPGTVFAIALATAFSRPPLVLVATVWILPLAYLVRGLPLTGRAVLAGYRQLDPAHEEAAASLGAGWWRTLFRVTLPLIRPGLLAGAVFAFVSSFDELVVSLFVASPLKRTLPVQMYDSLEQVNPTIAAASTVFLLLTTTVVLLMLVLNRTEREHGLA
jgi:iron(III) transport system permease protein